MRIKLVPEFSPEEHHTEDPTMRVEGHCMKLVGGHVSPRNYNSCWVLEALKTDYSPMDTTQTWLWLISLVVRLARAASWPLVSNGGGARTEGGSTIWSLSKETLFV